MTESEPSAALMYFAKIVGRERDSLSMFLWSSFVKYFERGWPPPVAVVATESGVDLKAVQRTVEAVGLDRFGD